MDSPFAIAIVIGLTLFFFAFVGWVLHRFDSTPSPPPIPEEQGREPALAPAGATEHDVGATFTHAYEGSPRETGAALQADAARLASEGWFPVNQTYTPGSWSGSAFFGALILCLVLVGILVFIYMVLVKPAGTLVVTWEYRGVAGRPLASAPPPVLAPTDDPARALTRLNDLRDRGLITPEEYAAKRAAVLDRL